MRHLRDDTVLILDGEVRVYRRERSRRWQAAFSIDGKPIRISTGKKDLNEAKEIARDTYLEYKFRHKNDLPVITKKFADVARLAIADMRKQLDAQIINQIRAKEELGNVINCRSSQSTIPTMEQTNLFNFAHEYKLSFLQSKRGKHLMLLSLENFMQRRTILSPSVGNV